MLHTSDAILFQLLSKFCGLAYSVKRFRYLKNIPTENSFWSIDSDSLFTISSRGIKVDRYL